MNCPYCGKELKNEVTCDACKKNISFYVKSVKASNSYYNIALNKAKVRDLSNAIVDLKKSIQLNKANYEARNLLGLIYYEVGEIVAALTQWVLSKHFNPDNEMAERYLNDIQSSPTKIDNYNQSFKKFNLALQAAKQGNDDLALIHLKKVVNLNLHFIKAMHLMALIYIKQEQYAKANKILQRAKRIDVTNNTTLRYLEEVKLNLEEEEEKASRFKKENLYNSLAPVDIGQEAKSNWSAFLYLVVGIVIGIAVVATLVVPSISQKTQKAYNKKIIKDSDDQTSSRVQMTKLEDKIDEQTKDVDKKQKEIDSYENKMENLKDYNNLLAASRLFINGDKEGAALKLAKVNSEEFVEEDANVLYEYIKDEVYDDVIKKLAEEGRRKCNSGKLEEALVVLKQAYDLTDEDETVLYFLGRTYQKMGEKEKAKEIFEKQIDKFPNTSRSSTAKKRLREMGYEYKEKSERDSDNEDSDNEDSNNEDSNNENSDNEEDSGEDNNN